jgi:ligand-binding sensor domain-containing protein
MREEELRKRGNNCFNPVVNSSSLRRFWPGQFSAVKAAVDRPPVFIHLLPVSLSLFLILLTASVRGQAAAGIGPGEDWMIDVWNSDRGLPESSVVSLAQTPDGYLWLGTLQAGVARFDGERFVTYDSANAPELPRLEIQRLFVDNQGVLWIAMLGGQLARAEAGRFIRESGITLTGIDSVRTLVSSGTNDIYFSTMRGWLFQGVRRPGTNYLWKKIELPNTARLSRYAISEDGRIWYSQNGQRLGCWHDGHADLVQTYPGLKGERALVLITGPDRRVWVGTESGLSYWKDGAFVDMTPTNGEAIVPVRNMVFASDGGIWVNTPTSLRKCRERRWVAEADPWSSAQVSSFPEMASMHADLAGGVWYRHRHDGVWHVQANGQVWHLTETNGLPNGQNDCLLPDREGNVWLGLEGGGLVRLRPRRFDVLRRPDIAEGAVIRSVCEDAAGGIWLGGSDGKIFRSQGEKFEEVPFPSIRLPVRDVTLWPDQTGGMWAGTVQNGAWHWQDGVLHQPFSAAEIGTVVRVLFQDRSGRLWLGNEFGLYCWSGGHLEKISGPEGFDNEYVLALSEDVEGSLWIGTSQGNLWRLKGGRLMRFALPPTLPRFRFWSVLAEADGSVWVGTLGGGLLRWRDGKLARITSADGLPCDTISQLVNEGWGNLWGGRGRGFFRPAGPV